MRFLHEYFPSPAVLNQAVLISQKKKKKPAPKKHIEERKAFPGL